MDPVKSFKVFGEPVEILVNGTMTPGSFGITFHL
jgi:hypothetical protein